jgi:hypothetical protein
LLDQPAFELTGSGPAALEFGTQVREFPFFLQHRHDSGQVQTLFVGHALDPAQSLDVPL